MRLKFEASKDKWLLELEINPYAILIFFKNFLLFLKFMPALRTGFFLLI
jgi:hypothetical protein